MTRFSTWTAVLTTTVFLVLTACDQIPEKRDKYSFHTNYDSLTFNPAQWTLSDTGNWDSWHRREYMMKDLLDNHLKQGMTKMEVLNLLGEPYTYSAQYDFRPALDTNGRAYKIYENSLHDWVYNQQDTTAQLLQYNRGFSGSGPNLFIIVFDKDGKVVDFLTADAI